MPESGPIDHLLRVSTAGKSPLAARHPLAGPRLLCLALALVTLLLYLPVRRHGFVVYDDPDYVTENPPVRAGLTWAGVKWAFTTLHASNWHPITWLSHMVDCELFGLDAAAHHLVSVSFHAINSGLLLLLLFRLTGALWISAFIAAMFAWHPLHVESVAWVAERKDVLSTMFWMLSLLMYVRHRTSESEIQRRNSKVQGTKSVDLFGMFHKKAGRFYVLAVFWFALGLMSKPMLVTLPFTLLLLDYWPLRRIERSGTHWPQQWRGLVLEKWPFFLLAAASCVITFVAQRWEAVVGLAPYPLGWRLENAFVSYLRYSYKAIWPVNLAVIYPLPHGWPLPKAAAAAALLILISWLFWRVRQTRPHLLVGWLWFFGTLVPVIGLVQVGGQAMADRYSYVPLIGLFIAFAFEARNWIERWHLGTVGTSIASMVVLAASITVMENQLTYWADSQSLFTHAIAVTGDNAIAHLDLGVAFEEAGQRGQALREYQQALELKPGLVQAHNNLGNLYNQMGKTQQALEQYQEALRLKPEAPLVHANLGSLLLTLGRVNEAMSQFNEAARLAPREARYEYLIGKAFLREGRSREAVEHFQAAWQRDPNDLKTLVYLARVLAADVDQRIRNGTKAVEIAERANDLSGGEQPFILDTLGMAYAESGHFAEARQRTAEAIERAKAAGDVEAVFPMQSRLHLYESGLPYREVFTNAPPEQMSK